MSKRRTIIRKARSPWQRIAETLSAWWPREPAVQAILAVATLLIGIFVGLQSGGPGSDEIGELRAEMSTMSRAVALSLLEHQSASERLQGVSWSRRVADDDRIVRALLDAVSYDSDVNVRLAAVEALAEIIDRPGVSDGLVDALDRQRSPLMQLEVASLLLAAEPQRMKPVVEEMLERPGVDDGVKGRLREVMGNRI